MEQPTQLLVALRRLQHLLEAMELRRLREAHPLPADPLRPVDPLLLLALQRLVAIPLLLRPRRRRLLLPLDLALVPLALSRCHTPLLDLRRLLPPALHQRLRQLLPGVQYHLRLRQEVATQAWYHRPEAVLLVLRALQLVALQAMVLPALLAHLLRGVLALLVVWPARATGNSSGFATMERRSGSQSQLELLARTAKL